MGNFSFQTIILSAPIEKPKNFLDSFILPALKNLDPSLFQNVILGILAIFIPFAIPFLTDILDKSRSKRNEFEKLVLIEEVLSFNKLFWISVIGLFLFSFLSKLESQVNLLMSLISIFLIIIIVVLLSHYLFKVKRFSISHQEFEISYLKKLIGFFNFSNDEKIFKSWNSLWSDKNETDDQFTQVFIKHIDNLIQKGKFKLTINLGKIYIVNIEKRDPLWATDMLRKTLEWSKFL